MKEISIEEKAKAYDEAIKRAKELLEIGLKDTKDKRVVLSFFPELAESEDKKMIQYFKDLAPFDNAEELYEKYGFSHKDAIAWLEKKGEQKGTLCDTCRKAQPSHSCQDITALGRCALEKQSEQKLVDKIEPKFKVGDTIKCKYDDRQFTIKSVDLDKGIYTYTQEGCGNDIDYADEEFELVEQKPWSEEDEKMIENIIDTINMSIEDCDVDDIGTKARFSLEKERDWLKSLKDRYAWKPSDKQIYSLDRALRFYGKGTAVYDSVKELLEDLKKLKD